MANKTPLFDYSGELAELQSGDHILTSLLSPGTDGYFLSTVAGVATWVTSPGGGGVTWPLAISTSSATSASTREIHTGGDAEDVVINVPTNGNIYHTVQGSAVSFLGDQGLVMPNVHGSVVGSNYSIYRSAGAWNINAGDSTGTIKFRSAGTEWFHINENGLRFSSNATSGTSSEYALYRTSGFTNINVPSGAALVTRVAGTEYFRFAASFTFQSNGAHDGTNTPQIYRTEPSGKYLNLSWGGSGGLILLTNSTAECNFTSGSHWSFTNNNAVQGDYNLGRGDTSTLGMFISPHRTSMITLGRSTSAMCRLYGDQHSTKPGFAEVSSATYSLAANTTITLAPRAWKGIVIVTTPDGVGVYLCIGNANPVAMEVNGATLTIGNPASSSSTYGIYDNSTNIVFENAYASAKDIRIVKLGEA